MHEILTGNLESDFDANIYDKLKCYVYALRDPRDNKIFYIGKGGGQGGGNQRVFEHFNDAKSSLKDPLRPRSPKLQRIIEIWSADEIVDWFIVRHGLDEQSALHVEAALIDALEISQNGPSLNDIGGHGSVNHGLLIREAVYSHAAQPAMPSGNHETVFIFPINKALRAGKSPYEATRYCWSVTDFFLKKKNALAIGVSAGISKGVFRIDNWKSAGDQWEFEGQELEAHELLNKNFYEGVINKAWGFFLRGNYLVVEFDGKGRVRFQRGSSNKDWQAI